MIRCLKQAGFEMNQKDMLLYYSHSTLNSSTPGFHAEAFSGAKIIKK